MKKILLKKILKWVLIAIVLGGIGFFALMKYAEWYQWENYGKHTSQVTIEIQPNYKDCQGLGSAFHRLIIKNNSEKIVKEVRVNLQAYEEGYSNLIGKNFIKSYKILKPQTGVVLCVPLEEEYGGDFLPKKPNLEIYISNKYVIFYK